MQNQSLARSRSKSHISLKSEKLLVQKILKEMECIIKENIARKQAGGLPGDTEGSEQQPKGALQQRAHKSDMDISGLILNDMKLDLVTIFEVLIKMGLIKYSISSAADQNSIQENEKKLVYLLWSLLKGDKHQGVLKINFSKFLLSVLGLNWDSDCQNPEKYFTNALKSINSNGQSVTPVHGATGS